MNYKTPYNSTIGPLLLAWFKSSISWSPILNCDTSNHVNFKGHWMPFKYRCVVHGCVLEFPLVLLYFQNLPHGGTFPQFVQTISFRCWYWVVFGDGFCGLQVRSVFFKWLLCVCLGFIQLLYHHSCLTEVRLRPFVRYYNSLANHVIA